MHWLSDFEEHLADDVMFGPCQTLITITTHWLSDFKEHLTDSKKSGTGLTLKSTWVEDQRY